MGKYKVDWREVRPFVEDTFETYIEIARRFGVSSQTVGRNARKFGWKRPDLRRPPQPALRDRLKTLIEQKVSHLENSIANGEELSVSERERQSREIGSLVRSVEQIDTQAGKGARQQAGKRPAKGKQAGPNGGDDDAERWRKEIAQRLARLSDATKR